MDTSKTEGFEQLIAEDKQLEQSRQNVETTMNGKS